MGPLDMSPGHAAGIGAMGGGILGAGVGAVGGGAVGLLHYMLSRNARKKGFGTTLAQDAGVGALIGGAAGAGSGATAGAAVGAGSQQLDTLPQAPDLSNRSMNL